jgi:hypothetical protein
MWLVWRSAFNILATSIEATLLSGSLKIIRSGCRRATNLIASSLLDALSVMFPSARRIECSDR